MARGSCTTKHTCTWHVTVCHGGNEQFDSKRCGVYTYLHLWYQRLANVTHRCLRRQCSLSISEGSCTATHTCTLQLFGGLMGLKQRPNRFCSLKVQHGHVCRSPVSIGFRLGFGPEQSAKLCSSKPACTAAADAAQAELCDKTAAALVCVAAAAISHASG